MEWKHFFLFPRRRKLLLFLVPINTTEEQKRIYLKTKSIKYNLCFNDPIDKILKQYGVTFDWQSFKSISINKKIKQTYQINNIDVSSI